MKKGWFIYNHSLHSDKFKTIINYFKKSFEKENMDVEFIANKDIEINLGSNNKKRDDIDFIVFWDKDIHLGNYLESLGYKLFNPVRSIELADNKIFTYQKLHEAGISIPKTIVNPLLFGEHLTVNELRKISNELGFPLIVKEAYGSFGRNVYMINTLEDMISKVKELEGEQLLFQEFIQSSYGKDVRVQIVGERVVASMLRETENGFIPNISSGGRVKKYELSELEKKIAVQSTKTLGLDFAGIDLLLGEDGPIVCEVNSNGMFKLLYEVTGELVSDHIARYIKKDC